MHAPLKYRSDIDGLRAIAVLSVIFFHVGLGCAGGFVGVDIFFVISGYLITGLILKDLAGDQFELLEFWTRRVRRILPALLAVIVTTLVAGWFFLFPVDFAALGKSIIAQAFLSSNIYFWTSSGYFGQAAEFIPLLHTWSLAVEEQFYLFFPFLLVALKHCSRRTLITVATAIGFISFGLSVYSSYTHPDANFYLLPMRAWELLIGGVPAMLARREVPLGLREVLAWIGTAAIAYAVFFYTRETRFPGLTAFLPCGGAALIIWANTGSPTSIGKILALPPMVFVGLISYSLYLWHWPILVYTKYLSLGPLTLTQRLSIIAASVLLATISWKWIETPFRQRVLLTTRARSFSFAGITGVALLLIGGCLVFLKGVPSRFSPQVLTYLDVTKYQGQIPELSLKDVTQGNFVELGSRNRQLPPRIFLWGDSHAMTVLSILDTLCREHGIRGLAATHSSTTPLLGFPSLGGYALGADSIPYNDAVVSFIRQQQIHDVLIVGMWGGLDHFDSQFRPCLDETIRQLTTAGAHVWIMRQVPRPSLDVPRALAQYLIFGGTDPAGPNFPMDDYHRDRDRQDGFFHDFTAPGVTLLDPTPLFFDDHNRIIVQQGGLPLYFDAHHLSTIGAERLRPLLEPIFDDVAKPAPIGQN